MTMEVREAANTCSIWLNRNAGSHPALNTTRRLLSNAYVTSSSDIREWPPFTMVRRYLEFLNPRRDKCWQSFKDFQRLLINLEKSPVVLERLPLSPWIIAASAIYNSVSF